MDVNTTVVSIPDQVSAPLDRETVILNVKTGVYFGLNPIGARIWNLIAQPMRVSAVRDIILSEYEVDPQRCEQDVLNLLENLQHSGLLNVVEEAP